MASYKVIQDIEAEDKLVGPLTLRQFIYACIAAICGYLSFVFLANGLSLLLVLSMPPMLFTGFFAFPFGRDQPTEVWALAKIRFYVKSRKRLWDQSGVKDLVNITAPKREEKVLTNGLTSHEVQSRLSALASTLDTRGWAVKNVYSVPPSGIASSSDRLLDISAMPQQVPAIAVDAADDILDEDNNPRAQQLQQMVTASTASHKQQLLDHMRSGTMPSLPKPTGQPVADHWFTQRPIDVPAPAQPIPIAAVPAPAAATAPNDETTLMKKLEQAEEVSATEHLKTVQPLEDMSAKKAPAVPASTPKPPVTPTLDAATINLANNNDLNIATIARIAHKQDQDSNEVVISLH